MSLVDFRAGAGLLMEGSLALAGAKGAALEAAVAKVVDGSSFVRALSTNPYHQRLADEIVTRAADAATGRNVPRAIESAMDGASLLLRSVSARGL